jgi:hypothetical protein
MDAEIKHVDIDFEKSRYEPAQFEQFKNAIRLL